MITMISMVNNEDIYATHVKASTEAYKDRIEYMPLYNVTHPTKAYNQAITHATHNLVVCCHQDVKFIDNFEECLNFWLSKLPTWGICGLAGTTHDKKLEISDFAPYDKRERKITKVMTIDGLCVILEKQKPLRFDEELKWWHFYAEDIALQANDIGLGAYVLPCKFYHLSPRSFEALPEHGGFTQASNRMKRKWRKCRPIHTTVGTL